MHITKKAIRLDQYTYLPFENIETAIKGIEVLEYHKQDDTLLCYILDSGEDKRRFMISGIYAHEVINSNVMNFLGRIKTDGDDLFLFLLKKEDKDFLDLSSKSLYKKSVIKNEQIRAKGK